MNEYKMALELPEKAYNYLNGRFELGEPAIL
jgi:hypothetical protein